MLPRKCPCGLEFVPKRKNQRYHSIKCRHQIYYINHKKTNTLALRKCICGKEFMTAHRNQKYCDTKCRDTQYYERNKENAKKYYVANRDKKVEYARNYYALLRIALRNERRRQEQEQQSQTATP